MKSQRATTPISAKPLPAQRVEIDAARASAAHDTIPSPHLLGPGTQTTRACECSAVVPLPARLQSIGAELTSIFSRSHLLWPGQSWNAFQVVIIDSAQSRAWIWNDQSLGLGQSALSEIDFLSLPSPLKGMLGNEMFRGNPAMSVDLALFPETAGNVSTPAFIIHEILHQRIQEPQFVLPAQPETDRWPRYPLSAEPRYLRNQLIEALRSAFFSPSRDAQQAALSEAAYWYATYKNRFPQEAVETDYTDLLEMPAQHAENMATLLARCPECDTEEALVTHAKQHPGYFDEQGRFEKSMEPYRLGTWSGLLLRERNRLSDFKAIEHGENPLDVLFRDVEPALHVSGNQQNRLAAQQKVTEANARAALLAESFFEQLAISDNGRILIPFSWRIVGFSASEPATLTDKPGDPTVLSLVTVEIQQPQGGSLKVQGASLVLYEDHPLAKSTGPMAALVVPPNGLRRENDGSFTIGQSVVPGLAGAGLRLKEVTADDGLRWLIPVE